MPESPSRSQPLATNPVSDRIAKLGLLLTLVALCALTWRKWGYLPIDSGREMYVPAAIAAGKRLYFDLWYPYGPLIPYWHATLFRVFGIHLGVLIGAGLSVVAILTWLLYSVSREFLPVWLSFTTAFAFLLQAFQVDLFNYILPYSYAAAYGSMFSVLLLWLLLRDGFEPGLGRMLAAGLVAGLMALTKPEFGAAGYAGIACAILVRRVHEKSARRLFEDLCACAPGALLCLGIYGWYLHTAGVDFFLGQNLSILPSSHFQQHFARLWNERTGLTLSPRALALSVAKGLAGFAALVACVVLAARSKLARWTLPAIVLVLCGLRLATLLTSTAAGSLLAQADREAVKILRPLFFSSGMIWIGLVVVAIALTAWLRGERSARHSSMILLSIVAMACGVRVLTRIVPTGYSMFFDVLIYLAWLVGLVEVSKRFSIALDGNFGKALAGIICMCLVALTLDYYPIRQRSYLVSSERGTLYTTPAIGKGFAQVLAFLDSARRNSQSFAIMPEDTSLYFLSGAIAPSPWYIVTPQVLPPGEPTANYIRELERADLRYIVISDRSTPEFGLPVFGVDYGQPILQWIKANYRLAQQIGDYQPVAFPAEWGALIYERK